MKVLRTRRSVVPKPKIRPRIHVNKVYQDTRSELRKISWPSREEIIRLTMVVIALSIFMAVFLGVIVDGLFLQIYQRLVGLK